MNKISHQNNTVVCYQHLSSYQCKAQHNWKERIYLGANNNRNNKGILSVCIRYWMQYIGLHSKQEPWVNCSNLPCTAELFSSAWNCLIQGTVSRSRPWLTTLPSASPPCLFFSPFTEALEGWEMLFIFWKLLAVLLCLWFPEEWLCGVSEQLLRADPGWQHTSLGTLSITLSAFPWGRTAIYLMEWHIFQCCQSLNIKYVN